MFEIMESRVLAILLSTVVAFITEKATGIIATQLRLPCKRKREKMERQNYCGHSQHCVCVFRKGGFTENLRLTLCNKEKKHTNKAKTTTTKTKENNISIKYRLIYSLLFFI